MKSNRSSSDLASVIISAGYRLLLNEKPFTFIRSIDVRSTQAKQYINIYDTNESPYKTPVTLSKKLESPSDERTIAYVFLQNIIIAITVS